MSEKIIRYSQRLGTFDYIEIADDGTESSPRLLGVGWAGNHEGKNNPDMQEVHDVGPLPRGSYAIGPLITASTGPNSMRLTPYLTNRMFGRDGFLIHGPALDPAEYGQESKGCAVLNHNDRMKIPTSGATRFEVVE